MLEERLAGLKPMTEGVSPITVEERRGRIEKARALMAENGIAAMYLEAGSSLFYFTGVRWGQSERMMAAVIPAEGEIAYVCPAQRMAPSSSPNPAHPLSSLLRKRS